MELLIDTADVKAWQELMPTGIFRGITTNPLLAKRAGLSYPEIDWGKLARQAADLGARELHGQVFGPVEGYLDWAGAFYEHGRKAGIDTVVKIPLTEAGIRATSSIKSLGGRILMTAAYDARQMFVAAALGADYIAPYFGRMVEKGLPAVEAMEQMHAIGQLAGGRTRILVASIRNAGQMTQLAGLGLDCFTIAPAIARELLNVSETIAAALEFEAAATPFRPA
jgi:transaldolase